MSVFDKYPNLPGFATEFKDGGLQVRAEVTPPGTDSVLLLGTAIDGPIGEPVAVDPATVELVFGSATGPLGQPNGSTLVKNFYEAWEGGSRDIRLMRITGQQATAEIIGEAVSHEREETQVETLGLAPGNAESTFVIAVDEDVEIDTKSLNLSANGYELPASAFTFDFVTNTLKVKPEVTSSGADLTLTFRTADIDGNEEAEVRVKDANGKALKAAGADTVFTILKTPKAGTVKFYADGVELAKTAYQVDEVTKKVTLLQGKVKRGALLKASYIHATSETQTVVVKLESAYGGSIYNQAKVSIEPILNSAGDNEIGKNFVITKPDAKKAQATDAPLRYSSIDYPTIGLLVQAINADSANNIVRASTQKQHENLLTQDLSEAVSFSGGEDGVNVSKQEIFDVLDGKRGENGDLETPGVYHLLENYTVDFIVPLGVYADDVLPGMYDNFASQLALACAVISYRGTTTYGMIATSSPDEAGLAAVRDHVAALLKHKNDYFMRDRAGNILRDGEGKNIDLGQFISVVAGPDVVINGSRLGTYADNSVAGYAGFISQLAPQSGPTNKIVGYAGGLRYTYSNAQLDKLTAARYVTLAYKNNGTGVAVVDGPTAAQPASDYRRISTSRVAKEVQSQIREVCDPFIGEPNEVPQRNAMSSAISKRLEKMTEAGVIAGHDFVIVSTPQMRLMGEAQVELTIVAPQELRAVTLVMALTPGQ